MPNGEASVLGGQVIIERIGREDGGEIRQAEHADAIPPGPAAGVLARPQLAVVSGHRSVVLTQLSTDHNLLTTLKLA